MSNVVQLPEWHKRAAAAREAQRIWLGYQKLIDDMRDTIADAEQVLRSNKRGS